MSASFTVREMRDADIDAVIAIEKAALGNAWTPAAYRRERENPAAVYLLAESEAGELLGYGGMWVVLGEASITALAVIPEARGRGVGRAILTAMIDEATARSGETMVLEVRPSNAPAQKLYASVGFVKIGVRPRYYPDNDEDADLLALDGLSSRRETPPKESGTRARSTPYVP